MYLQRTTGGTVVQHHVYSGNVIVREVNGVLVAAARAGAAKRVEVRGCHVACGERVWLAGVFVFT